MKQKGPDQTGAGVAGRHFLQGFANPGALCPGFFLRQFNAQHRCHRSGPAHADQGRSADIGMGIEHGFQLIREQCLPRGFDAL